MNIQQLLSNGLTDATTALVGVLIAFLVAFVKQHFSAKQISTGAGIAAEAVNFAAQAAKKLGITENTLKYSAALGRARDLAKKAGINLSDSQWETLIESAWKQAKDGLAPITDTATPLTEDDIIKIFNDQMAKVFVPAGPQEATSQVVDPVPVVTTPTIASVDPKPITQVIEETIGKVGEQAKTQAVSDLTAKFAAVVQEAVGPVVIVTASIPDPEEQTA